MSNLNDLKQQLLTRITNANNLSELKEITNVINDFQRDSWSKPNTEREKRNQSIPIRK